MFHNIIRFSKLGLILWNGGSTSLLEDTYKLPLISSRDIFKKIVLCERVIIKTIECEQRGNRYVEDNEIARGLKRSQGV
jgi:hypothetical protein